MQKWEITFIDGSTEIVEAETSGTREPNHNILYFNTWVGSPTSGRRVNVGSYPLVNIKKYVKLP